MIRTVQNVSQGLLLHDYLRGISIRQLMRKYGISHEHARTMILSNLGIGGLRNRSASLKSYYALNRDEGRKKSKGLQRYWLSRRLELVPSKRLSSCTKHVWYFKGCPDCMGRQAEVRHEKRLKSRSSLLDQSRLTRERIRREVLEHYGGTPPKCACCGYDDGLKRVHGKRFLELDHVKGQTRGRRNKDSSTGLFWKLKRLGFPKGFRVLCAGCNAAMEPSETMCELHKWHLTKKGAGLVRV